MAEVGSVHGVTPVVRTSSTPRITQLGPAQCEAEL